MGLDLELEISELERKIDILDNHIQQIRADLNEYIFPELDELGDRIENTERIVKTLIGEINKLKAEISLIRGEK
ncbi:hypothetical protein J7L81_02320 [Candidatus Aerophobetes bacterium]|nr:hypothetical protein [Candidatus Aerophobetes bacterium]